MDLTLLTYNNKYNRIDKRPLESIDDYVADGAIIRHQLYDVQEWNPNDGITTTQVINYEGPGPDYLIVSDGEIVSRWFIMEAIRTRYGQYQLQLLRDVIADNFNAVINSPMLVERATAGFGDPALYNAEDFGVNQILTRKDLLYDTTACPWIVGYIPKNYPEDTKTVSFDYFPVPDYTVNNIEDFLHYDKLNTVYLGSTQTFTTECFYSIKGGVPSSKRGCTLQISSTGIVATAPTNQEAWSNLTIELPVYQGTYEGTAIGSSDGGILVIKDIINESLGTLNKTDVYNTACLTTGYTQPDEVLDTLVGKTIRDTTADVYYKIVKKVNTLAYNKTIDSLSGSMWDRLKGVYNGKSKDGFVDYSTTSFQLKGPLNIVKYELESAGAAAEIDFSINRTKLEDQPYDMFCIPYSDNIYLEYNGIQGPKFNKALGMGLAQALAAELGSSAVYDMQILPYCPALHLYKELPNGTKMMTYTDVACTPISSKPDSSGASQVIGALFWCSRSQFSFEIDYDLAYPTDSVKAKVMQVCDKYRLCSPNMASFFDFDPIKNDGLFGFEVDCYYKPFNPYIHINPKFGGLYGSADYEVRGLDLGGNFSLTQTSNAWADYQLQNKNFQNVFDRQQEHLEVQRKYQKASEITGAVAGAIGAGAQTGIAAGSVLGPWGGVAVGAAGTVVSGLAGAADVVHNEKLYQEQRQFNLDNFNMSNENIQALPQGLTKVDTLSPNNSLIPYVEYYTCSAIERIAAENYFKYNGMTINRIGTINEFLRGSTSYVRGRILRLEDISEDFHTADVISKEIMSGVYI